MIMPINKGFILKSIGQDYMIIPTNDLNIKLDTVYNINYVASRMFELLSAGKTASEVAYDMSLEFNASKEEIEADVLEFIGELKKRGIYND